MLNYIETIVFKPQSSKCAFFLVLEKQFADKFFIYIFDDTVEITLVVGYFFKRNLFTETFDTKPFYSPIIMI